VAGASRNDLTIGEVAERFTVPHSTLRYWERIGLLAPPPRREAGRRRYEAAQLAQIGLILAARRLGFGLPDTRLILAGLSRETPPPEVWRRLAARKLAEVEETLAGAQALKEVLEAGLRCECISLEACFGRA
jgi:DNA-binding transcriptional MerR regulator